MTKRSLPPAALAISFVDCINRGDLDGLVRLMSPDHQLVIFDEGPVVGREANREAWRGYMGAFPDYVIHPRRISCDGNTVAVLGHTTGSHLGLPDEVEQKETLIWVAHVRDGAVRRWILLEDSAANRTSHHLDDPL